MVIRRDVSRGAEDGAEHEKRGNERLWRADDGLLNRLGLIEKAVS
jgi:hypothetical protein